MYMENNGVQIDHFLHDIMHMQKFDCYSGGRGGGGGGGRGLRARGVKWVR